jgi:hypothetical protein
MALPSGSTAPATTRRGTIVPPQSATRYIEKRKEVEAILALERATAEVASRFDALSHDLDVVAEAAKGAHLKPSRHCPNISAVHGSVLAHWPHMFELVALFCKLLVLYARREYTS